MVVASEAQWYEFEDKFGEGTATWVGDQIPDGSVLAEAQVVFDFVSSEDPTEVEVYQDYPDLLVMIDAPKISLAGIKFFLDELEFTLVGFNGLPGMLNRPLLEVSLMDDGDFVRVEKFMKALGADFRVVEDRVGMVTPRIVCMIINEAFYTVQEGTATEEDIDQGMRLGTNYPKGPFEWCDELGIENVYEVLEAIYDDTKDERYKICPLLKRRYLMEA